MPPNSGKSIEVVGISNDEADDIANQLKAIIERHLLPKERLLPYYVQQTPIYTGGPQVAISVKFPDKFPEFLQNLRYSFWPPVSPDDNILFFQANTRLARISNSTLQLLSRDEARSLLKLAGPSCNNQNTASSPHGFEQIGANFNTTSMFEGSLYDAEPTIPGRDSSEIVGLRNLARKLWRIFDTFWSIFNELRVNSYSTLEKLGLLAIYDGQSVPELLLTPFDTVTDNCDLYQDLRGFLETGIIRISETGITLEPFLILITRSWLAINELADSIKSLAYERIAEALQGGDYPKSRDVAIIAIAEVVLEIDPADVISTFNRAMILDEITRYSTSPSLDSQPNPNMREYEAWSLKRSIFGKDQLEMESKVANGHLVLDLRLYDRTLRTTAKIAPKGTDDIIVANSTVVAILKEKYQFMQDSSEGTTLDAIKTAICLSVALVRDGSLVEATKILESTLAIQKSIGGIHDWELLGTIKLWTSIENHQLNFDAMEEIFKCELQEYKQELGPTDERTMWLLEKFASTMAKPGLKYKERAAKAEKLYQTLYEQTRNCDTPDNTREITAFAHIGHALSAQERFADAEIYFSGVLPRAEEKLGKKHWFTAELRYSLAIALHGQDDYNRAEKWYQTALEDYVELYGSDDQRTLLLRETYRIALLYNPHPRIEVPIRGVDDSRRYPPSLLSSQYSMDTVGSARTNWTFRRF